MEKVIFVFVRCAGKINYLNVDNWATYKFMNVVRFTINLKLKKSSTSIYCDSDMTFPFALKERQFPVRLTFYLTIIRITLTTQRQT